MDRAFEGLSSSGAPPPQDLIQPSPPQYIGLYLSVANKTWQIYKTNQNKVIDIKRIMLTLQNVADVIKN